MGIFDWFRRKPTPKSPAELMAEVRATPARKVPAPTVPPRRAYTPARQTAVPLERRREDSESTTPSMLDPLNPLSPLSPISPLNPLNDTYYSSAPSYTPDPTPSCDTSSSYSSSSDSSSYSSSSDSCSYDSGSSSSSDSGSW